MGGGNNDIAAARDEKQEEERVTTEETTNDSGADEDANDATIYDEFAEFITQQRQRQRRQLEPENNKTQVAVGRSLEDIIGRSSSGSDCGETLLVAATATTKKRSASSNLLPSVRRTVSTRSQAAGDMKRRLFPI